VPWSLLITGVWLDSAKEQAVRLTKKIKKNNLSDFHLSFPAKRFGPMATVSILHARFAEPMALSLARSPLRLRSGSLEPTEYAERIFLVNIYSEKGTLFTNCT
jgi:hypothetical protein